MNTINLKLMYAYINFKMKWIYNHLSVSQRLPDLSICTVIPAGSDRGYRTFRLETPIAFGKGASALKTWPRPLRDAYEVFHAGLSAGILDLNISVDAVFSIS